MAVCHYIDVHCIKFCICLQRLQEFDIFVIMSEPSKVDYTKYNISG